MIGQDEYSFCRPFLGNGEYICWKGKPEKGNIVTSSDLFMIPFSIFWCGFAIFWEITAITGGAPIFFALWGIPFVCVGLYMVFGRFIWTSYIRKRTWYVITNKKIIRCRGNKIDMLDGKMLPPMRTVVHRNGNGSIRFGMDNPFVRRRGRMSWEYSTGSAEQQFALENIAGVLQAQQAIENMEK